MARDDDWYPDDWYDIERELFDNLVRGEPELLNDDYLQDVYDRALWDLDIDPAERAAARDELEQYLWDEYNIDFAEDFDWEDWRDWYDSQ